MTIAVLRFKVYLCNELQDTLLIKSMIIKKTNEAISIGFPFTYFSFLQPVRRHYAGTRTKKSYSGLYTYQSVDMCLGRRNIFPFRTYGHTVRKLYPRH